MKSDDFEWDDAKAAANLAKHSVSFEQARDAFDDPFAIDLMDDREDYREQRLIPYVIAHQLLARVTRVNCCARSPLNAFGP